MMRNHSVAPVLARAADIIEKHGWCRRYFKDSRGRVCMLGALAAAFESREPDRRWNTATALIERVIGQPEISLWNDSQKTRQPVIAALRKAAILAAREE